MDELHRHRSFTDSGSYAFNGTVAHIAHGKDARNVGLEQERVSLQRPALGKLTVADQIGASQ